jgi:hypothetical protein
MKLRTMGVAVLAALIVPSAAQADQPAGGARGPRVRVTAPSVASGRLVGTLLSVDETTLTIWRSGHGALNVPRDAVMVFEVCRQRGEKLKGAGRGAAVGLGLAVAMGVPWGDDASDAATVAFLSALLTVPLGTLVGMGMAPEEEWETTTTPDRVSVAVAPVRGGVRAAVSIRF